MKKNQNKVLVLLILTTIFFTSAVFAANSNFEGMKIINIVVNDKIVTGDVPAVAMNGRTMVPLKFVSEALGGEVTWDAITGTVYVKSKSQTTPSPTITLSKGTFEGNKIINVVVNNIIVKGDVPAVAMNGRTMVPIKFVSEALGAKVTWDAITQTASVQTGAAIPNNNSNNTSMEFNGKLYKITDVDGGNLSGYRQNNAAVNIGFGDREYWAFTNEFGQLISVKAAKIILQDDLNEPVLSSGRYYPDEAKVPGTEREDLDKGHVIADSLGGVSNAYNITPQDSTLNRYGDQAYMEKVIRDAGGCTNFIATITYLTTNTQIPSHYKFVYELNGNKIVDEFENVNPDKVNASLIPTTATTNIDEQNEIKKIDTNGNGQVTIAEAKAAGFKMPIYNTHWLYKYMIDGDGDGKVGE